MNYNVKGTGTVVTDELRAYVEKSLAHTEKFLRGDTGAHADVELHFAESEGGKKYRAEITLMYDGEVYRSNKRGDSLHEAIDIAGDDLARSLSRNKKKRLHLLRSGASRAKEFLRGFRKKI